MCAENFCQVSRDTHTERNPLCWNIGLGRLDLIIYILTWSFCRLLTTLRQKSTFDVMVDFGSWYSHQPYTITVVTKCTFKFKLHIKITDNKYGFFPNSDHLNCGATLLHNNWIISTP
jgi:hypothetical protein